MGPSLGVAAVGMVRFIGAQLYASEEDGEVVNCAAACATSNLIVLVECRGAEGRFGEGGRGSICLSTCSAPRRAWGETRASIGET